MASDTDVDDLISYLYRGPPQEFTKRRDELASRLKQEGRTEDSNQVRSCKRPTVAAWAVDQLTHESTSRIKELARIVTALSKETSPAKVRQLVDARHGLIATLSADAQRILQEHGTPPSPQVESQITQTLVSATSSEDIEQLLRGTLAKPLSGSGFAGISGVAPAPVDSRADDKARSQLDEVEERLKRARRERDAAQKAMARAAQEVKKAERSVQAAEARIGELERKQVSLRARLEKKTQSNG
jgi:hypothetical protein